MEEVQGFEEERTVPAPGSAPPPAVTGGGGALQVLDFGDEGGAGMEGLSMNEQLTPFLRIIQKGSPQADPSMGEYMEAARPGMLLNTATGELYDGREGVEAVICFRDYHYGVWVPRDSGGGFRGMLRPEDPAVRRGVAQHGRFKKLPHVTEDGAAVELVETIQLGVLYKGYDSKPIDEATAQRAIASFTSTAMPVAQQYITKHNSWRYQQADSRSTPAPIYQYRWRLSLVPVQKAGNSWFNWKIDLLPPGVKPIEALIKRTDPIYAAGKEFYELFRSGQIKADYGDAPQSGSDGADIPF